MNLELNDKNKVERITWKSNMIYLILYKNQSHSQILTELDEFSFSRLSGENCVVGY